MPKGLPPELKSGLVSLRRRIRRVQLLRGLFRTVGVFLLGVLALMSVDYFFAPLVPEVRVGAFVILLVSVGLGVVFFIFRPLVRKLPLIRLARWLEARHPETEERISTALELSERSDGISQELLAELSRDAVSDLRQINPRAELGERRIHKSMWPAGLALLVILLLLGMWPRETGRLLTRAFRPFSALGNAGAFRFTIQPGDGEVLEGNDFLIELSYQGELERPLEFVMERDGKLVAEELEALSSEGGVHRYTYQAHAVDRTFTYSARVGRSQSDRFKVEVFPLPRLLDPEVTVSFPPYTSWPERKFSLGAGVEALAGSEITLEGRLETPLESAELVVGASLLGEANLESSANGTAFTWTGVLPSGLDSTAKLKVKHQLGQTLEARAFRLKAVADPAPLVKILTPVQREFRVRPDEQIIITYEVEEKLGVVKCEIELEVDGKLEAPLLELLPERVDGEMGRLWEGDAMVLLGTLLPQYQGVRSFRMRLALSDNRPPELGGPGIGYSEWLEFRLDKNAESLVRQELRKQDQDLRETVNEAIRDIEKAKLKMHQVKGSLYKEEVSERSEKTLSESRERLQRAQENLNELRERMKQGLHAHRGREVDSVLEQLEEAKTSVESSALQDSPEARISELDDALRESKGALDDLRQLKQAIQKDEPRTEDLAHLQEMAQRQAELARQVAENALDQEWQEEQRRMQEEIREKVKKSPEAKAAAMRSQSERVLDLAQEAAALNKSQEELATVLAQLEEAEKGADEAPQAESGEQRSAAAVEQALTHEQEAVIAGVQAELSEARAKQEARANDLPEALAQAENALTSAKEEGGEKRTEASQAARQAARELSKGAELSASQMKLKERQERIAEALQNLAEGRLEEALAEVEKMQALRAAELAQDIQSIPELEGNTLKQAQQQVRQASQNASQAMRSQQEGKRAQAVREHEQSAKKFQETSQSLAQASEQMAQRADQASQEAEDARSAPAPGEELAQALEKSSQAANASQSQEAAAGAEAAAEALRKAAHQAEARMKRGGKSGDELAQAHELGEPGQGEQATEEAKSGLRENQGSKGIPPELAKLGVSVSDWEKIQATMADGVGGGTRAVIPEDYRGLVKKYFEKVIKKQ